MLAVRQRLRMLAPGMTVGLDEKRLLLLDLDDDGDSARSKGRCYSGIDSGAQCPASMMGVVDGFT